MSTAQPSASDHAALPLPCPQCKQSTDSLKLFELPTLVFVVFAWALYRKSVVACPKCMRKRVLTSCLVNVPTANLLWPFIILPLTVILLLIVRTKGHSKEIVRRIFPKSPAPRPTTLSAA